MSKKSAAPKKTFEECYEIIDAVIQKNRHRWQLVSIPWMDWDDVSQIIKIHIHKKWNLYNSEFQLEPWVNRIAINQIKNLRRNVYDNMSRPCLRCPENQGGDLCAVYQTQNSNCELFKKWEKTKKHAHDVRMTVSSENHQQEMFDMPYEHNDLSDMEKSLHHKMQEILKPVDYKIYKYLFIDGISEEEAIKKLNYSGEKNKKIALNNLIKTKKMIIIKVKKILDDGLDT
jgi:DNA-directed RNA polymerase specialized sigma24 family protein